MPPKGVPHTSSHRAAIAAAVRQSYLRRGRLLPMQQQVLQCAMNYTKLADRQERMPQGTPDEHVIYERLINAEQALRRMCRQLAAASQRNSNQQPKQR